MPERPVLILPAAQEGVRRDDLPSLNPPRPQKPSKARQVERLTPAMDRLRQAFQAAAVQLGPEGLEPEKALVFEIIGALDAFMGAVERTEGLEWLSEMLSAVEPDEDFYLDKNPDKPLSARLYLLMASERGMQEILTYWRRYQDGDGGYQRGFTAWRDIFSLVKEIRPWGAQDRLHETGVVSYLQDELDAGMDPIRFEIELWPRASVPAMQRDMASLRGRFVAEGGRIISQCSVPEIRYFGVLAELPAAAVQRLLDAEDHPLAHHDGVMYYRAFGQSVCETPAAAEDETNVPVPAPANVRGAPVVAIFDGYPLQNHALLRGRLIIDDRDGFGANYPVQSRQHGTQMASLVLHGDLGLAEAPLERRVYLRPIMTPDHHAAGFGITRECTPRDRLLVDLIHRAVVDLFNEQAPAAPSIRVINLSIGDHRRLYADASSPLARLIDWLCFKYQVLFVISAGNHTDRIVIPMPRAEFERLAPAAKERLVIESLNEAQRFRRLRSPAESINALTVGAAHADGSNAVSPAHLHDVFTTPGMGSPLNPCGRGVRKSIKPDILMPGGRQTFQTWIGAPANETHLEAHRYPQPPGQQVAVPGHAGALNKTIFTRGTSNAAALASRGGDRIYGALEALRAGPGGAVITRAHEPVLIKALLAHGAQWGDALNAVAGPLRNPDNVTRFRDSVAPRFLGYGLADVERVQECTQHRVTLIGCGALRNNKADVFRIPLPVSLGRRARRRVVVTLAWFSPIRSSNAKYRVARLWFDDRPLVDRLRLSGKNAGRRASKNGTLQHAVLEGEDATPVHPNEDVELRVNCKQDAYRLPGAIPYVVAVTLETAEALAVDLYQEVAQVIVPARVQVR